MARSCLVVVVLIEVFRLFLAGARLAVDSGRQTTNASKISMLTLIWLMTRSKNSTRDDDGGRTLLWLGLTLTVVVVVVADLCKAGPESALARQ